MKTEKIKEAIKATEKFLKDNEDSPEVDENYNFTIVGCEKRNLKAYKELLNTKDKRKLRGWMRELYFSI